MSHLITLQSMMLVWRVLFGESPKK